MTSTNTKVQKWVFWPLANFLDVSIIKETQEIIIEADHDAETFHHLVRVNRLQTQEVLAFINPSQVLNNQWGVIAKVISISKTQIIAKVLQIIRPPQEPVGPSLVALVAIIKPEPFEWLIEKLTELGVQTIIPFTSNRTQPHFAKKDPSKMQQRFELIMKAAASQCERWYWPQLTWPALPLEQAIQASQPLASTNYLKLVAVERQEAELKKLQSVLDSINSSENGAIIFATGPEGGFTDNDLTVFDTAGFQSVTLGRNILRAETASLMLASCIQATLNP